MKDDTIKKESAGEVRERASEALRRERYRDLFENANDAIFLVDADLNYVDVNRKAVELSGYPRHELLRMNVLDLIPEEQKPRSQEEFIKLRREGHYEKFHGKIKTRDGRLRDILVSSSAIFENGIYIGSRDIVHEVTDEVRAEQALRENEARLKKAQAIAHVGDWEWELANNRVHWSDELYRIYGYQPREIAPDYGLVVQAMHPDSRDVFLKAIDAALKGEKPFEMDYRFFRKDGSIAVLHTIGRVTRDAGGAPIRMIGIVQDITEQKKAEETLRQSEEKFRNFFDTVNDGILIADSTTRKFIEANKTICSMTGYTREELLSLSIEDIHPKDDLPRVLNEFEDQVKRNKVLAHDLPVRRKDGTVFYVDITASPFSLNGQQCSIGVFRDITDRKQVEETLKVTNTRLRTLINTIPDMVIFKDLKGRHLIVNKATEEVTGHTREEFIGKTVEDLLPPGPAAQCRKSDEDAMRQKPLSQAEEQVLGRPGNEKQIEMLKAPMVDDNGDVVGLVAIGRDITERKRAEEALRNSEQFIRNILDTVDEGFIVIDRDFRIITANKAYCRQAGEPPERVIGRHCYEISHQSRGPCYEAGEDCAVRRVFETGEPNTAVHRHTDGKGSMLYVETKAFPIKDYAGRVTSVIETVNNITEKHLLEEERLKTQKLEAIGTLAGGIAHDFNNLLQGIFGYISMAKNTLDHKERSLEMLKQAEQALHTSVNLTKQLLTFSKGGRPVKAAISLRDVVENSVKFALSGSRADYGIHIDKDLRMVEADEGQISQVIQNLVLNADQAMPLGGTLAITVKNVQFPKNNKRQQPIEGNYIEIAIRDSGVGIPEQYLTRIFDPYFTTKEKGSGLGLATSYSIIKNHGGAIDVASKPGEGSTFSIYLPAIDAAAKPAKAVTPRSASRKGKILFMDDEDLIRSLAGEMIRTEGHEVELAENGDVAVKKYLFARDAGRPFDVVILDLTVRGGMGGKETIKRLHFIDPAVKAVVSSGYSDDSVVADYSSFGFAACLTKPYEIETLRETLNKLLA